MQRPLNAQDSTAAVLDDHEHVEQPECRRDRHEEITGDSRGCVIAQDSCPTLIASRAARRSLRHAFAHRPRGDPQAELQQQFVGDPLFAPERILARHAPDQLAQLQRNPRSSWS